MTSYTQLASALDAYVRDIVEETTYSEDSIREIVDDSIRDIEDRCDDLEARIDEIDVTQINDDLFMLRERIDGLASVDGPEVGGETIASLDRRIIELAEDTERLVGEVRTQVASLEHLLHTVARAVLNATVDPFSATPPPPPLVVDDDDFVTSVYQADQPYHVTPRTGGDYTEYEADDFDLTDV